MPGLLSTASTAEDDEDDPGPVTGTGFAAAHMSAEGGFFINGSPGKVIATGSTGIHYGVNIAGGASATAVNHGTVQVTVAGGSAFGIDLFTNGNVTNDGLVEISANGAGGGAGIVFNTVGTVVNSGTVLATGTGGTAYRNGIYIEGGNITNQAGGLVSVAGIGLFSFGGGGATISNASTVLGKVGIAVGGRTPTVGLVNNSGSVNGGVYFGTATTGTLINSATGVITAGVGAFGHGHGAAFYNGGVATNNGTIIAGNTVGDGIIASTQAMIVVNYGAISAPGSTGIGVQLSAGGRVKNDIGEGAASVSGGNEGVYIEGGAGTVANYGQIQGSAFAVNIDGNASVTNFAGVLKATGASGDALSLLLGGVLSNVTGGQILGVAAGVSALGTTTITNTGTITASTAGGNGVVLAGGGVLSNNAAASFSSGVITGSATGVDIASAAGMITNYGTIAAFGTQAGTASYAGVRLAAGGELTKRQRIRACWTDRRLTRFCDRCGRRRRRCDELRNGWNRHRNRD